MGHYLQKVRPNGVSALPLIVALLGLPGVAGLSGGQAPVRFEVTSVKLNDDVNSPSMLTVPLRGNVVATGYPLLWLIRYAYGLTSLTQISGGPEWLRDARFDIRAVRPDDAPISQVPLMMQQLLKDRFQLQTHWEAREQPVHALTVARPNGNLGPNLRASPHDCAALRSAAERGPQPLDDDGNPICRNTHTIGATTSITLRGTRLSELVMWLEAWANLDRPLVDETGLAGTFDIQLTYARPRLDVSATLPKLAEAPDIPQALQEQLGLKLERKTATVRMLVIDSLDRPTQD